MGLVLTVTFGMCLWVVLWALGVTGFDGFMLAALVVLLGGAGKILASYLPGGSRRG
jgi:hypothetical protein